MRGVPEELVFLLIFGFVWLVQFLRRQRRRQPPPASEAERDAERDAEADVDAEFDADARTRPAPRAPAFTPNLAEGPRRAPVRRDRPAPASSARNSARRYSRSALMGDRRGVQDAIVVAAILQPCRARRPYGAE